MAHQLTTTLNRIKAHNPNHAEWNRLLAGLGKTQADDEPLPFAPQRLRLGDWPTQLVMHLPSAHPPVFGGV
jgi:hypothetical protein